MPVWATALVGLISAAISGGGAVAIVKGWYERKPTQARATDQLSDTAIEQVRQALSVVEVSRAEARDARAEAISARREANEARREAVEARIEAMQAAATMRRWMTIILDPYMTMEELRNMVKATGGAS